MSGKSKVLFVLLFIGLAREIPVTSSYSSPHISPQGSSSQRVNSQDSALLEIDVVLRVPRGEVPTV